MIFLRLRGLQQKKKTVRLLHDLVDDLLLVSGVIVGASARNDLLSDELAEPHSTTTGQCSTKRGKSTSDKNEPKFDMADQLFLHDSRHIIRNRVASTGTGDTNNVTTQNPTVKLASANKDPTQVVKLFT